MFSRRIAQYINTGLEGHNLTYKALEGLSGVPASTLHAWAQGKVKNPNDEYLIRIAAAFGDPPDIIQQMRRESLAMTVQENKVIADAHDKLLMETYVELINSNVTRLLEQSRIDSDARYVARLNTVRDQYDKLFEEQKASYAANLKKNEEQAAKAYSLATEYLKADIRYYRRALRFAVVVTVLLGSYALYAFNTFDRADPTRGIYRADPTPTPEASPLPIE